MRKTMGLALSAAILLGGAAATAPAASAIPVQPVCHYSFNHPTLGAGRANPYNDVRQAQCLLNVARAKRGLSYASLSVDGLWGTKTEGATRTFQSYSHLSVDGVIGGNTWGALESYNYER